MRIALSVLLTCWPPAPLARKVSMRSSAGFSVTSSASSGSGITATVQALVWMRPCALGGRHALHAVAAGFEAQRLVDLVAVDAQHQFLVAAEVGRALAHHLGAPAAALAVAQVHARQVAGEQRRFVAAGAGADFQEGVARVVRVARQQRRPAARACSRCRSAWAAAISSLGQLGHLRVGQHLAAGFQVALALLVLAELLHHLGHLGLLARQAAVAVDVGQHLRVGQVGVELGQAQAEAFELLAQGGIHGGAGQGRGRATAARRGAARATAPQRR